MRLEVLSLTEMCKSLTDRPARMCASWDALQKNDNSLAGSSWRLKLNITDSALDLTVTCGVNVAFDTLTNSTENALRQAGLAGSLGRSFVNISTLNCKYLSADRSLVLPDWTGLLSVWLFVAFGITLTGIAFLGFLLNLDWPDHVFCFASRPSNSPAQPEVVSEIEQDPPCQRQLSRISLDESDPCTSGRDNQSQLSRISLGEPNPYIPRKDNVVLPILPPAREQVNVEPPAYPPPGFQRKRFGGRKVMIADADMYANVMPAKNSQVSPDNATLPRESAWPKPTHRRSPLSGTRQAVFVADKPRVSEQIDRMIGGVPDQNSPSVIGSVVWWMLSSLVPAASSSVSRASS